MPFPLASGSSSRRVVQTRTAYQVFLNIGYHLWPPHTSAQELVALVNTRVSSGEAVNHEDHLSSVYFRHVELPLVAKKEVTVLLFPCWGSSCSLRALAAITVASIQ